MTNATLEALKLNIDLRDKRDTIDMALRKLDELNKRTITDALECNAISKIKTNLLKLVEDLDNDVLPDDKTSIYDIKSILFRI